MYYHVIVPTYLNETLTYQSSQKIKIGQIVEVPLKTGKKIGIVADQTITFKGTYDVKQISAILPYFISKEMLEFILWMNQYTLAYLGMIAKMVLPFNTLPAKTDSDDGHDLSLQNSDTLLLSAEQKTALEAIRKELALKRPIVLDGVTGSGKTEVYLSVVQDILTKGQQTLILLPEIALTQQLIDRITQKFGQEPYVWHSSITPKQKQKVWQIIQSKKPCIVIGARSALMLPFQNLGLIVVDEEHDPSYKQEALTYYHARDMAVARTYFERIPCLLVSATPSIETLVNAQEKNKYGYVKMENRFGQAVYPTVTTVPMQLDQSLISKGLREAMEQTLDARRQVLLFLNRRGYAPVLTCEDCGYRLMCPHCSVSLVLHQKDKKLKCHYCGHSKPLKNYQCPKHGSLIPFGPGVEKVAQEVQLFFPNYKTLVMTSDHMSSVKKLSAALDSIKNREVDIVIGTQILAKGHHFPYLTLVGIIDGDMGLSGPDFRCSERTYQLLHQVAGRSGREQDPGQVIIQTLSPNHPVMQALIKWDRDSYIDYEIQDRKRMKTPPFGQLASILVSGTNIQKLRAYLQEMQYLKPYTKDVQVLGPVPAPLSYLKNHYRYRFLIQTSIPGLHLQHFINAWLTPIKCPTTIKQIIDINPQSFS